MRKFLPTLLLCFFTLFSLISSAQGRLILKNTSERELTVKVMKGSGGRGVFTDSVVVESNGTDTVFITKPGAYFLKTKATMEGKDTIFQKGRAFQMYIGVRGASEITMTFTIKEDKSQNASEGVLINRKEYEQN